MTSADDSTKSLAFAVVQWLQTQAADGAREPRLKEAAALVSEEYGVDPSKPTDAAVYGANSPGLRAIFDVFLKTQKHLGAQQGAKKEAKPAAPAAGGAASDADVAKAEQLKNDGNKFMSAKDYGAALGAYTKAIELHADSPVYYSNRAAAYSQIGQHDEAVADATKASEIDPSFGKAYSRLGHALFASGRFADAVAAYEKGVEVDPGNKLMQSGLDASKAKLADDPNSGTNAVSGAPGDAAPGMGGAAGAGGMPDLGALLNNPMVGQMAQQMMGGGGIEQLMNNPMLRQMAGQFGGANGQMPDIGALMNNPQLRQMAQQFMGAKGGAGGAPPP
ncbi:Small glutamine-rich tetratricopeptide repeat-containing protein 2 [Malassezia sp. CBS 17886]|nr:Small glutamine-rich tetratricopeptide repeat-containing protein 2 [Malassezia sp. CBS 17886]